MNERYTISQLAQAAEVPTTTIRYYERVGLVQPENRSAGNYRLYNEESLQTLRFIRSAQAIGFALDDVKTLFSVSNAGGSCRKVQGMIEERLSEIGKRLKDLRHVQKVLKSSLRKCRDAEQDNGCHVIQTLRETGP